MGLKYFKSKGSESLKKYREMPTQYRSFHLLDGRFSNNTIDENIKLDLIFKGYIGEPKSKWKTRLNGVWVRIGIPKLMKLVRISMKRINDLKRRFRTQENESDDITF